MKSFCSKASGLLWRPMKSWRIRGIDDRATGPSAEGSTGTSRQPSTRSPWCATLASSTASYCRRRAGLVGKKHIATP